MHPVFGVATFAFIALLILIFFASFTGAVFSPVAEPLIRSANWMGSGMSAITAMLGNKTEIARERDALREELELLQAEVLADDIKEREHDALRSLVGLDPESRVVAGILARPNRTPYDTLYIDKGQDDGVREGAYAYAGADLVIGSVVRSYKKSALIELYSAPGVESQVYVHGPDVIAKAKGQGSGTLRISVPKGLPLESGDTIVLPTAPLRVLGEVAHVDPDPQGPEAFAYTTLPIGIQSLRYVSIGKDVPEQMSASEFTDAINHASSTRAFLGPLFSQQPAESPAETDVSSTTPSVDEVHVEVTSE